MHPVTFRFLLIASLALPGVALAQSGTSTILPEWDQLSEQQRDALLAPVRDRWNHEPSQRSRMLEHAQRWQSMTPEQRQEARKGMRRFSNMEPQQRQEARALFARMRTLDPAQREKLREQWKQMTPEQRRQWVEQNPPGEPLPKSARP